MIQMMMRFNFLTSLMTWCVVLLFTHPICAQTSHDTQWIMQQMLQSATISTAPAPGMPVPGTTSSPTATPATAPMSCPLPPMRVIKHCEAGGGFLCVDTPIGGTTADHVTLTGLIDRTGQVFAGLMVTVQHDQTKQQATLATEHAVQPDGHFALDVPLTQLGSYTVAIQALRAGGKPALERALLSRVQAPHLEQAVVTLDPDPAKKSDVLASEQVNLSIDLLPQCEHCDFLGSHTGATTLIVTNLITTPSGAQQRIERRTDLGADGRYALCLPTANGTNHIEIAACNAATGDDTAQCPHAVPIEFSTQTSRLQVTMIAPAPDHAPIFDAKTQAQIPIRFRVDGLPSGATCDNAVMLEWNRQPPVPVCADSAGVYTADVTPEAGINLATIRVTAGPATLEYPVEIGWGALHSPWQADGQLKPLDTLWYEDADVLGVRQQFMAETVRNLINHVAMSDRFAELLQTLVDAPAVAKTNGEPPSAASTAAATVRAEKLAAIKREIPGCDQSPSAFDTMRTQLVEPPQIGTFEISRVGFAPDEMQLDIGVRPGADGIALKALVRMFRDDNHDGTPDFSILPLKIAFRALELHPQIRLVRGAQPVVLLTTDTTNCDFQNPHYCEPRPALLVPQHFVGGATSLGGFVLCDHEEQSVPDDVAQGCVGLNELNMQTGLLSTQVLDALNNTLYCSGSTALTYLLREGFSDIQIHVGCHNDQEAALPPTTLEASVGCNVDQPNGLLAHRHWDLPIGYDVVHSVLQLSERGMSARFASRVGNTHFYQALPKAVQRPTIGYLTKTRAPAIPTDLGLAAARDFSFGLSEARLNQVLFALAIQGDATQGTGVFDWDLHEVFFQQIGFDFVKSCDAFVAAPGADKPPTLCNLRPRVGDLLGTSLTTNGYFPQKQPLMMRLRGSRQLAPHVRFFTADVPLPVTSEGAVAGTRHGQFIDVEIPDLEIAFYALETDPKAALDKYGNPTTLLDTQGAPVIHSMRPSLPDPLDGPIIRTHVTVLLTLELGELTPDPADPSQLQIVLKTNPYLTRLAFRMAPGANSTLVRDESLLSAFREKMNFGVNIFGNDRDAFRLHIPKRVLFPMEGSGLTSLLGVQEVRLAKDGLSITIDPNQDFFTVGASLSLTQRLRVKGELQSWVIPEE